MYVADEVGDCKCCGCLGITVVEIVIWVLTNNLFMAALGSSSSPNSMPYSNKVRTTYRVP